MESRESVFGISNRPGLTLLELLIGLLIIGIMGTMVVPTFQGRKFRQEREQFIVKLNGLVLQAWRQALVTGKPHGVVFNFGINKVWAGEYDQQFSPVPLKPLKQVAVSSLPFPPRYQVKQFFIEGFDEMKRYVGKGAGQLWFFIMPGGLSQHVIINFVDTKDKRRRKPHTVGLVLNPFTAQFKVYDEFQK